MVRKTSDVGDVYVIGAEEYTQATEKTEETYHHNNDVE